MRLGWVAFTVFAACSGGVPQLAVAASCYLSDLAWSDPGRVLRFLAGDGSAPQTLELDVATGAVVCTTPRCSEPSWDAPNRRVLWRDDFGAYALDVERPGAPVRALAFLPAASRFFLRAVGSDAHGALLLWTFDRDAGEHRIWVRRGNEMQALPGSRDGAEMLRQWDQRNVAVPFRQDGGQFVRSLCLQQEEERICLEQFDRARRSGAPLFRLVLGGPKRLDIVIDRCVPTGVAAAADTSRVVLGLLEEIDAEGRSDVLSAWVVDFERATRVAESLLPGRIAADQRHRVWGFWTSRHDLLWCDASGQLFRIATRPAAATRLVATATGQRAMLHWVVAAVHPDLETAQARRQELEVAGFAAAVVAGPGGFEVQTGAFPTAELARDRAEALQGRGFAAARVEQGGVEGIAPGLPVSVLEGPEGERYVVRHRREGAQVVGEIWVERDGAERRLLLPGFDTAHPAARGEGR